jgi:hypothetical protein
MIQSSRAHRAFLLLLKPPLRWSERQWAVPYVPVQSLRIGTTRQRSPSHHLALELVLPRKREGPGVQGRDGPCRVDRLENSSRDRTLGDRSLLGRHLVRSQGQVFGEGHVEVHHPYLGRGRSIFVIWSIWRHIRVARPASLGRPQSLCRESENFSVSHFSFSPDIIQGEGWK